MPTKEQQWWNTFFEEHICIYYHRTRLLTQVTLSVTPPWLLAPRFHSFQAVSV